MDEFLSATIEVEKMLVEIGKTPYEPLQEEKEEELTLGETSIDKHVIIIIHGFFFIKFFSQKIPKSDKCKKTTLSI